MGPLRPSRQECSNELGSPTWGSPRVRGSGVYRRRSHPLDCTVWRRSEARSMKPVEKVLKVVDGYKERHNGLWCICPAHDDHNPSLHVEEAEDGRALLKCRAGCDQADVMDALERRGLKRRDLF